MNLHVKQTMLSQKVGAVSQQVDAVLQADAMLHGPQGFESLSRCGGGVPLSRCQEECMHPRFREREGVARIAHSLDVGLLSILLRHALLLLPARQSKAKILSRASGMYGALIS